MKKQVVTCGAQRSIAIRASATEVSGEQAHAAQEVTERYVNT